MNRRATIFAAIFFSLIASTTQAAVPIATKDYGVDPDGNPVTQIILTNKKGSICKVISYGAIVTDLLVPDKSGKLGEVVLGYENATQYAQSGPFMGCIAGRFANRLAKGLFTIDGVKYAVPVNAGANMLHGGFKGYAKRLWVFDTGVTPDGPTVRLKMHDPDGDEGFPGNVDVTVLYTLTQNDTLKVQYFAHTDKATPINLTHHSYFNLTDGGKSDILNYVAQLNADHYLPADATLIPTGDIATVTGTPYDFTKPKLIGQDIKTLPGTPPGYDNAMVLNSQNGDLAKAATIYDPASGRQLECWTTEPCVHFFTGNNLTGIVGRNGDQYAPYHAFCLETQHFPDGPNHPNFPNTILRPGDVYRQVTEFRFSIPATPLEAAK